MSKKLLYILFGVILLIVVALIWHWAPEIQRWLAGIFVNIIVLILTFIAGWCFGRFGRWGRKQTTDPARR